MTESIYNEHVLQKHPFVIAIIPAYNEASHIQTVISETSKYVDCVIVVDDGSTDNTSEIADNMEAIVIRNKRNMGKGFALRRGLQECLRYNPDIVLTLDADGQHDASEIPRLLMPIISKESDVVIGSRYQPGSATDAPRYRMMGLYLINNINRILVKTSIKDSQSGYRAYTKDVLSTILKFDSTGYGVEVEQLALIEGAGFRITEVPITIRYGGLGITSKKEPFLHGIHILTAIFRIAVERKPLLFFGLAGFIVLCASIIPATELLTLFNEKRYFSLPLGLVSVSLAFLGFLLILISFVFFALKRIRQREEIVATTLLDLLNKMKK
jgi:glycosyltransferase involved in cell wall biosynthesis